MKAHETVNATGHFSTFSLVVGVLSQTGRWVILVCYGIVTSLSV